MEPQPSALHDVNAAPVSAEVAAERIGQLAITLRAALGSVVFGQSAVIDMLLVALFSEGHVLLEGPPGTAKTTLVKTFAQIIGLNFSRIQLTPDMLPAEITGTSLYDLNTRTFSFRRGPVFTELLLADEINRTPPKTQAALLEAMEERQVTADGERHPLPPLFTVMATLNPIEFEGTFPLPEAQLDRFLMKILIPYPSADAERQMLRTGGAGKPGRLAQPHSSDTEAPFALTSREALQETRHGLSAILVDDQVMDYLLAIIQETRRSPEIALGASPRAALALLTASRAHAAIQGRAYVTPDDIKSVTPSVLRHRLILASEAEFEDATVDEVIAHALHHIAIPR
jgi:MoxR-like ATPase